VNPLYNIRNAEFSENELERFSRQIILPEIGIEGQLRLKHATVAVIGAGGLGSPALYYLAAAGVGKLKIADADVVELSNLQRQILHGTYQLGKNKAISARDTLMQLNPELTIEVWPQRINATNALEFVSGANYVLEGSDNFATKYLINDACCKAGVPLCMGGILRWEAQIMVYNPSSTGGCFRCLFPEAPPAHLSPTCSSVGIAGPVAGMAGSWQVSEILRGICGHNHDRNLYMLFDLWNANIRKMEIPADPDCPACAKHVFPHPAGYIQDACDL
jgi:molybdopterin/thiamine biosynthesis adenylyltransferase